MLVYQRVPNSRLESEWFRDCIMSHRKAWERIKLKPVENPGDIPHAANHSSWNAKLDLALEALHQL